MAKPGDELNDSEGGKIIFKETAATSNGRLLEMEAHYPANSESRRERLMQCIMLAVRKDG
jgi:hypothetical protein